MFRLLDGLREGRGVGFVAYAPRFFIDRKYRGAFQYCLEAVTVCFLRVSNGGIISSQNVAGI